MSTNIKTAIFNTQYFGCIPMYQALIKHDNVLIEHQEYFQKMSYRNRCEILGSVNIITLTVPLKGGRDQKIHTSEIEINDTEKWQTQHIRSLQSCYNKSAYFEHYAPELDQIINRPYKSLHELNLVTIKWVLKKLKHTGNISYTEQYHKTYPEDSFIDYRNQFIPKNRETYPTNNYYQLFQQNGFQLGLSILDLLFNEGPKAKSILINSQ